MGTPFSRKAKTCSPLMHDIEGDQRELTFLSSSGEQTTIRLAKILRELPGRRWTFEGHWGNTCVIVKCFFDSWKACFHIRRERHSLHRLQERGVSTAKIMATGRTEQGDYVLITNKIGQGKTVRDELAEHDSTQPILSSFIEYLADLHERGIEQLDLHPANFVFHDGTFWLLDPAQVRFHRSPLPYNKALSQLAQFLLSSKDNVPQETMTELTQIYFAARQWRCAPPVLEDLTKRMHQQRQRNVKKQVRKYMRTNSKHQLFQEQNMTAIIDRSLLNHTEAEELGFSLPQHLQKGVPLKNGNTAELYHSRIADTDVVIKHYKHKSFVHSFRQTLKGSRARRAWQHAHRLRALGIATPRPLAVVENKRCGLLNDAYLLTEHINGYSLQGFLKNQDIPDSSKSAVVQRVKHLLERLAAHKIVHNDLKETNILIADQTPFLTDLDAVHVYRSRTFFSRRHHKDWERFMQNWEHDTEVKSWFNDWKFPLRSG